MADPEIDDTAICPACDSSGSGAADTGCGYCGGCGGVPLAAAQQFYDRHQPVLTCGGVGVNYTVRNGRIVFA